MVSKLTNLAFNSGRQTAMVAFYRALGAELKAKTVKAGSECYQGTLGEFEISIYGIDKRGGVTSPNFSIRFEVQDVEGILKKLRDLPEADIMMDVVALPTGRQAVVLDPDGHSIELVEPWPETGSDGDAR